MAAQVPSDREGGVEGAEEGTRAPGLSVVPGGVGRELCSADFRQGLETVKYG